MRITDLFDDYLENRMDLQGRLDFEQRMGEDPAFLKAFEDHERLVFALRESAAKHNFKNKLKAIHEKEIGINTAIIPLQKAERFTKEHGRTMAVAASTAFIAVLGTVAILSAGGYLFKQQSNQITDLNRVVMELKASSDGIVEGITKPVKKVVYAPANLEGSAFALNNKGYIITSFHMVNGSDSIFIQNSLMERAAATLVFSDPRLDLAILSLNNKEIAKNWQVPFALKEKATDVGEKVFTLGYPRRDMVYGEGSLSSLSGYSNDTSMYQISIPVNPGNSGGPLLDEVGNVIGVIRGKISGAEATGFAIKAPEIIRSLGESASDSLLHDLRPQNPRKSSLKSLKRSEQIKRINPYVFNVLVYKKD